MPLSDTLLREAIAAHNAGRLTQAEVAYSRVLRQQPNEARALYGLGLLSYHSGSHDKGIQYLLRSLQSAPRDGRAWITLGSMYSETGRPTEAKEAYRRATEVAPDLSDGWYNVGICLKREGDLDAAAQQLRRAIACPIPYSKAFEALSALHYERGQLQEAAQTVADWAVREPTNPTAVHMAAAAALREAPARASDAHVRSLFDAFADEFDRKLQDLKYQAPELVASALRATLSGGGTSRGGGSGTGGSGTGTSGGGASGTGASGTGSSGTGTSGTGSSGTGSSGSGTSGSGTSRGDTSGTGASGTGGSGTGASGTGTSGVGTSAAAPFSTVLDAGCGTGLCGPLVRDLCRTLVGVDLSPKMLAHARRRGCYDELVAQELGAFMRSRPAEFDAIVCADTLVYFGDLTEPLAAARAALRGRGVLAFTVEALAERTAAEHRLEISGRYAHSEPYLRRLLQEQGFQVSCLQPGTLREERGARVNGYLVVARPA
jgi:predicted TPR repeat methyltransferase